MSSEGKSISSTDQGKQFRQPRQQINVIHFNWLFLNDVKQNWNIYPSVIIFVNNNNNKILKLKFQYFRN